MPIGNSDKTVDSRDVIARIEELTGWLEDEPRDSTAFMEASAELAVLKALAGEASASPDWEYGEVLISDRHFADYAEELAEDSCGIQRECWGQWPFRHIDWESAADELQSDYLSLDWDGEVYWIRA